MDSDYLDNNDWPTTAQGCVYELVTVGGAVIVTFGLACCLAAFALWLAGI